MLEVHLLGKYEVKHNKKAISIVSRPAQSLFAYLILNAGTSHRREKLAGLLWPDSLEETARDNLRHALWRVRKSLPSTQKAEFLLTDDLSIAFNASAEYRLDAAELEKLSESASADELMVSLSAYQGELLPGFYDEWVVLEREHLSSIFEHHMARLLSLLKAENRWLDVLDWAGRWIKLGKEPEPAFQALMSAHAAKGDMSKVAASYERCVKSLREFGMEPSEQTKELYKNLKSSKDAPTTVSVTTMSIGKEASSNIPVPLTSFVGRHKELKEIAKLLSSSRLLTLTGPGGVGKTRLAIETAQHSLKNFKDGVFWVGLVGLSDENLIPQEMARSLNVREVQNEPLIETLKTHLKSKDLLLVIDNCEHLIRACAQYAEQLLAACPKLKIMATSIEALGLFNETTWQVPSLPLPERQGPLSLKELQEFASIELFYERAGNAKSGFTLDERNVSSVAQICRRLDGIPLAIELAAARIKVLSIDEIVGHLDNRFSLLTAGSRTAIPRHQTLRATIDWSYELLTEPERILLRRLSVFAGGFTLEAAEAVCSQEMKRSSILDLLGRLVDKSLVVVYARATGGQTRYGFLETIREYALEKMKSAGEETSIRDRHLEYFRRLAEETEPHLYAPEQAEWFARTDAEIDNLRAALDWSMIGLEGMNDARIRNGLQLVGVLSWFWEKGYRYEFSERLKNMLSHKTASMQTIERARALTAAGFLHWTLGNFVEARPYLVEALEIARNHEDQLTLGWALSHLGTVLSALEEYNLAQSLLEECVAITKGFTNVGITVAGMALSFLGDIYVVRNHEVHARKVYEEGIKLLRETNNSNILAYAIRRFGYLALKEADHKKANALFRESLTRNQELGHQIGVTGAITGLAELALEVGKLSRAAQLFGIIEGRLAVLSLPLYITDQVEFNRGVSALRARLDEKTCAKFWTKGKAMPLDDAIAFALQGT